MRYAEGVTLAGLVGTLFTPAAVDSIATAGFANPFEGSYFSTLVLSC